jgi:hypothetical protein
VNDHSRPSPEVRKWLPAAAAAGVLAIVVVAGVALGGGDDSTSDAPTGSTEVVAAASSPSFAVIETIETSSPVVKTQLTRTLAKGMAGDDVADLQQRLTDLGFWPGPIDGYFGDETRRSVWAYEKLVLGVEYDEPTGQVTAAMWDDMQEPFTIQPRRPNSTPNHTEIYLPEQVIAVFHDDEAVFVSHMSSGDNEAWCEEVEQPGRRTAGARRVWQVDHPGWGVQLQPSRRRCPTELTRRHVGSGVLQLRHRRARRAQRAAATRIARLHPHPAAVVADLPGPDGDRRPGVRVRRRPGARVLRRAEALLQPDRPGLHDHDVEHDDHDDRSTVDHDDGPSVDHAVSHHDAGAHHDGRAGPDERARPQHLDRDDIAARSLTEVLRSSGPGRS